MSAFNQLEDMIIMVARALGDELLKEVAFLGGCATGLLITDKVTREAVRYTDDVDLITSVVGYSQWIKFQKRLRARGFKESMEDDINCRMRLENLIVDFMPDDENILGYTNRWYKSTLKEAVPYALQAGLTIQLVTADLFYSYQIRGL